MDSIPFPGAVLLIGSVSHGRIVGAVIIRHGSVDLCGVLPDIIITVAGPSAPGQGQHRHEYDDNYRENKTFPVHNGYF
jgi:hypothetical protein